VTFFPLTTNSALVDVIKSANYC